VADKSDLKRKSLSARGALAENYLKAGATTTGYYANAVREYRALLLDSPDNMDAMSNLGLALYHTKAYDEAAKMYRQVIAKDPKNAIAYNNLGVVLEASNRREEAIQNYRQALKLNPNYAEAKVNIERLTTAT
jgi:Flp pilus assembly protein TadD